jgi:hypothetical protein
MCSFLRPIAAAVAGKFLMQIREAGSLEFMIEAWLDLWW